MEVFDFFFDRIVELHAKSVILDIYQVVGVSEHRGSSCSRYYVLLRFCLWGGTDNLKVTHIQPVPCEFGLVTTAEAFDLLFF